MRKLSLKQKNLVKEYYTKYSYMNWAQLTSDNNQAYSDLINKLEKFNDYETLWSDVERLIGDLIFNEELNIRDWS